MIRALVLSDLHAIEGPSSDGAPSLMTFEGGVGPGVDLLNQCADTIESHGDKIDLVLVAGDLTNQADPAALRSVWRELNSLATRLNAPLFATAGNHDYDSRMSHNVSPKDDLLGLAPPFPFGTEAARASYFAYDYALAIKQDYCVLSLNSAAQHGYAHDDENEYEFGRVTPGAIGRLKNVLENTELPSTRILLVHHHIAQLPGIDSAEASQLRNAQQLTELLAENGEWLIIHGHKHRPWVQYASGNGDQPAIFSAGTFSAEMTGAEFSEAGRHQFYVISLNSEAHKINASIGLGGTIRAWTHNRSNWVPAGVNDGLANMSGFGLRSSASAIARQIEEHLDAHGKFGESEAAALGLDYLTPEGHRVLEERLGQKRIGLERSVDGRVADVYRQEAEVEDKAE